jgi:hypothetical protein
MPKAVLRPERGKISGARLLCGFPTVLEPSEHVSSVEFEELVAFGVERVPVDGAGNEMAVHSDGATWGPNDHDLLLSRLLL